MNETIKTLIARQSCRKYKEQQITDEELNLVLQAGINAATGGNKQTPILIALQDKELIAKFEKLNASFTGNPDGHPYYGAPTVVLVVATSTEGTPVEDGCLAIGNMLNAAYSLGLGSCWIHRMKEIAETAEGKILLADMGVTGDYIGVGTCILGYPATEYAPKAPRKEGYTIIVR